MPVRKDEPVYQWDNPYQIKPGDTPESLSSQFGITPQSILAANPGGFPFNTGQTINLPQRPPAPLQPYGPHPTMGASGNPYQSQLTQTVMGGLNVVGNSFGPAFNALAKIPMWGQQGKPLTDYSFGEQPQYQQKPTLGRAEAPKPRFTTDVGAAARGKAMTERGQTMLAAVDKILQDYQTTGNLPDSVDPTLAVLINNQLPKGTSAYNAQGQFAPIVGQQAGEGGGGGYYGKTGDKWGFKNGRTYSTYGGRGVHGRAGSPRPERRESFQDFGLLRFGAG